jgi:hypothetical protein
MASYLKPSASLLSNSSSTQPESKIISQLLECTKAIVNLLFQVLFLITSALLALALADEDDADPFEIGLRGTPKLRTTAHIAHGVVAGFAAAVFFPLGAILLRGLQSPRAIWIHWILQLVNLFTLLIGFALGVWLSYLHNEASEKHK